MIPSYDVYFEDLRESVQKQMLNIFKIKDPKEMNWDTIPIAKIPLYEE